MAQLYNVGSDIIRAYLGGLEAARAEREQRENSVARIEAAKEKQREFDEAQKLHREQLKSADDRFKAEHKLRESAHNLALTKARIDIPSLLAQADITPAGMSETQIPTSTTQQDMELLNRITASGNQPIVSGGAIPGQQQFTAGAAPSYLRQIDTGNQELGTVNVPDPFTYRRQQLQRANEANQPAINKAVGIARGVSEAQFPAKQALESIKVSGKMEMETAKEAAALKLAKQRDDAAYKRVTDAARMRGLRNGVGAVKDRLLNDNEMRSLPNAKLGDTVMGHRGETLQQVMTPAEVEKDTTLEEMEKNLRTVEHYGKQGLYKLTNPVIGTAKDIIARFGFGQREDEDFRQSLAGIKKAFVTLQAGKVLAKNEEALIGRYIPDLGQGELKTAVAVNKLLPLIVRYRDNIRTPQLKSPASGASGRIIPFDPNFDVRPR